MKLIVGLGNTGDKYKNTRHNVGFQFVDFLAKELSFSEWKEEKKFFGLVAYGQIKNEKVLLLKPSTYMNGSGKSVVALTHFYKINPEDIFIVFDDVDLPFGKIRFREKGGSGGHNGIKSIISSLGTEYFRRFKFGIRNDLCDQMDTADFVLGKFSKEEKNKMDSFLQEGFQKFQASF